MPFRKTSFQSLRMYIWRENWGQKAKNRQKRPFFGNFQNAVTTQRYCSQRSNLAVCKVYTCILCYICIGFDTVLVWWEKLEFLENTLFYENLRNWGPPFWHFLCSDRAETHQTCILRHFMHIKTVWGSFGEILDFSIFYLFLAIFRHFPPPP